MKIPLRSVALALIVAFYVCPTLPAADGAAGGTAATGETFVDADGNRTPGRLRADPEEGFRFTPGAGGRPIAVAPGTAVEFTGRGTPPASGLPPFRVEMGLGQRLSGRLVAMSGREVRLLDVAGEARWTVARAGVHALVQRAGESQVLADDFEALDTARWTVLGEPEVTASPHLAGRRALRLPAGGASLTHRLAEPFAAGRLEVAFHDGEEVEPGQQWFVDLTFRGPAGSETVRAVLGWSEESLAVESPGGPALAVQRLVRKPGWHRLGVRFGAESSEVSVDGNELAHGKGFGGPLVEVRLASYGLGKAEPPDGLAGHLDDLRLVRFAEPASGLESDAAQDEVRLTGGDQLFGKVGAAGGDSVELALDGRTLTLPWGEVAGLYFRPVAAPGAPVDGLLTRVEWRAGPGDSPRDLNVVEGALTALTDSTLTLDTPYAGTLVVPRDRLTAVRVVGRGRRLVIDTTAHHLGDEVSTAPPVLDPPQPEGGVLERTVELSKVPEGPAFLVLDVVQVVGEAPDLPFSAEVKKGELRTNVKLNGEPFDYLNRHITTSNETPERIRLAVPNGLLRPGKNVVRLELAGKASDPNFLDDLGILGVALEFPTPGRPPGPPRPVHPGG